jgi:signal transduction histidine kinase
VKGGAGGLELKPANIADIVKESIKEFQSEMDLRHIEAVLTFPEKQEDSVLNIDSSKIKTVLVNILDNAVKYNKENGKIFIKGEIITSSDSKIKPIFRLTIEDAGIGISREELPKLFTQYFERSEEAKKIYATGRGIGLNVVKSVIEAHHGQVFASSDGKDKGSKFIIELPLN